MGEHERGREEAGGEGVEIKGVRGRSTVEKVIVSTIRRRDHGDGRAE